MKKLLALLCLLVCAPAFAAAPAIVQQNWVNSNNTGNNISPALTGVSSSDVLLAIVVFINSNGATGVNVPAPADSSGDIWSATPIASAPSSGGPYSIGIEAYLLTAPTAGAHTLTFNTNGTGGGSFSFGGVIEISGYTAVDKAVASISSASATSYSLSSGTLASANELAIAVMGINSTVPAVTNNGITDPPTGWTSLIVYQNGTTGFTGEGASLTVSSTASITPTWSWTSGSAAAAATLITLEGSGGGSSCTHDGITSAGALAIPDGTTGSYWSTTGDFVIPNCSSVNYWQPTVGNSGVN